MSIPRITDYEILEKLGVGSYSTVYKAKHKKNRSFHAIKCVEKCSLSKSSTDNLVTEIKLLRALSHKYIVGLDDFFWDDKNIYIVLEYCNAGNLSAFIRSRKSLPEGTCKYFLRQLASGIQYMRSNDVCHFDLKPQNLLLTRGQNVTLKIADFGFAQHLKLGEINLTLKGSPLYMAPEIVSKHQYDAKADLWSIGIILYECLFGKAPYTSKTIEELLVKIKSNEKITIPPNTKLSAECNDLLTRLLQHEPSKRISFEDFFTHPFIDLKTIPSEKKNRSFHAIKCVEKCSLSKSSTDNLVTEIKLLRALSHKYIVGLDDFFWDDKNIYIVLEYCNAGNLSAFIRSRKSLPEGTCKYFLRQLASGIQYMRSNDVCHFDLKPQNLLLTRGQNVTLKIADFGFAQHLKLGEINLTLKGSPLYMAPEIVSKHQYDAKADLWSIGIILYECLFGKAPYTSKTIEELLVKIKSNEKITIPPNTKLSAECNDLLTRLLQHEPSKRISFEDFFTHPFIDLKTIPSEKTLQKAIQLVTNAVECDEKRKYKEAYHLYCNSLQYFVPLITEEPDAAKRQVLRSRALTYLKRAEEIKTVILTANRKSADETKPPCVSEVLEPDERFKQLYALSYSSPLLKTSLEIGRQAELYLYEKKFEAAMEGYTSALGILVPFVNNEPKSERRQLIIQQIEFWMKEAESIKSILCTKEIDDEQTISSHRSCVIQ